MAEEVTFEYRKAAEILSEIEDKKADLSEHEHGLLNELIGKLHDWDLFEAREQLYLKYIRELGTYTENFREEKISDEKIFFNARNLLPGGETADHVRWIDIEENGKIVGFLIMAKSPLCHPAVDYYIYQTYVLPEYRKRGLMSQAIRSFMKQYPRSSYCILISKNNKWAMHFWRAFFEALGYTAKPLSLIAGMSLVHNPDERLVGYEPDPKYFNAGNSEI